MICKTLNVLLLLLIGAGCLEAQLIAPNGMKKGAWRSKDVPEGWAVYNIGRYEFQSDAPEEKVRKVGRHLNAMFDLYLKTFPSGRTPKRFVVKIFKDRQGFLDYGAPPQAGAYYSWTDKEMVGYDTGKIGGQLDGKGVTGDREGGLADLLRSRYTMDLLGVFAHEGWHQYFHWLCTSKISFPSWCDEGIGEYFYTAMLEESGKAKLGAANDYRLGTIKAAIRQNKHIPLKELVTYDQAKYYRVAGLAYAQGWSLVHFFLEHPDWKKQRHLSRFVKIFVDEHSIEEAVDRVFGKTDWEKLESDWKEWVLKLEFTDAAAAKAALEDLAELNAKEGLEGLPPSEPAGKEQKPAGEAERKPEGEPRPERKPEPPPQG